MQRLKCEECGRVYASAEPKFLPSICECGRRLLKKYEDVIVMKTGRPKRKKSTIMSG